MNRYRVIFSRSEGMAETYGETPDVEMVVDYGVQLTYSELLDFDARPLARHDGGLWRITGTEEDYSDVSITLSEEFST